MGDDLTTITVDEFLPHPPARVWRTLTDPQLLARWLMPNDFAPVVGHDFTFRTDPLPATGFDGLVHCRVLNIEPERMLQISWRSGELDTVVTWHLQPEGSGTRLFLQHDGFDPDRPQDQFVRRILAGGWRSIVIRSLVTALNQEAAAGH